MLNPTQLKEFIVIPTLGRIGLSSLSAINLVCGTALVESNLQFLAQIPDSIALGLWQCENFTYKDLANTLTKPKYSVLRGLILKELNMAALPMSYEFLAGNLYAGAIFCRLKYFFNPEALPVADDIAALADYWSRIYNTRNLAADKARFISRYEAVYSN